MIRLVNTYRTKGNNRIFQDSQDFCRFLNDPAIYIFEELQDSFRIEWLSTSSPAVGSYEKLLNHENHLQDFQDFQDCFDFHTDRDQILMD